MKKLFFCQAVWLVLLLPMFCIAQNIGNQGKDFWVGYSPTTLNANFSDSLFLYIGGSSQNATVTVTIDSSGLLPSLWYQKTYTIAANTYIVSDELPSGVGGPAPNYDARIAGEGIIRNKGIHIVSDVPVSAYFHHFGNISSGMTGLVSTDHWGYAYSAVNSKQIDAAGPAYSCVFVIAKEDNTFIQITPSVPTRLNKPAGVPIVVGLQKGQIYNLLGQSDVAGNGNNFTGTTIVSLKGIDSIIHPIAAFAGSSRTRGEDNPCGSGSGRDNDIQQLPPLQNLGKHYLTTPFSTASGSTSTPTLNTSQFQTSVYKIVVPHAGTIVKRNNVVVNNLINGQYYQFSSNTPDYIEADQPIMVGQFMSGSSVCNPGDFGDPEMVIIAPLEQGIKKASFYRTSNQTNYANYATIVVPTAGLASLKINNSNSFNYTYPHPTLPGYSVAIKGWSSINEAGIIKCDSSFVGLLYGLGGAESYGYNIGNNDSISPAFPRNNIFPVKLISFSAIKKGMSNLLNWQTAQEQNLSIYEIQRSTNGIEFTGIGKVKTGLSNYSFIDYSPRNTLNYYRLKLIDKDGSYEYSEVKTVSNSIDFSVAVYPNPVKDKLQVQFYHPIPANFEMQIISPEGKCIQTKQVILSGLHTTICFDIFGLQSGIYFLKATSGSGEQQFVKFEKL